MEDESKFQINIPANVKVRVEIISGIGIKHRKAQHQILHH